MGRPFAVEGSPDKIGSGPSPPAPEPVCGPSAARNCRTERSGSPWRAFPTARCCACGGRTWPADTMFNALLDAPHRRLRWETPPITKANADRPFEFVLIDSPDLAREPDADTFAAHFAKDAQAVIEFPNMGRDAILIVPRPPRRTPPTAIWRRSSGTPRRRSATSWSRSARRWSVGSATTPCG